MNVIKKKEEIDSNMFIFNFIALQLNESFPFNMCQQKFSRFLIASLERVTAIFEL